MIADAADFCSNAKGYEDLIQIIVEGRSQSKSSSIATGLIWVQKRPQRERSHDFIASVEIQYLLLSLSHQLSNDIGLERGFKSQK